MIIQLEDGRWGLVGVEGIFFDTEMMAISALSESPWWVDPGDNDEIELQVTKDAREKRIDEAFSSYHDNVNMGSAALRAWSETEASGLASLSREPITRNLRLLGKPKSKWTLDDARGAMRTVSFNSRMLGVLKGQNKKSKSGTVIDSNGKRWFKSSISLRNWAFDPLKAGLPMGPS